MSDTPRTDAFWKSLIEATPPVLGAPEYEFASGLERELAAVTKERDESESRREQAMKLYELTIANEIRWMRLHTDAVAERDRLCAALEKCIPKYAELISILSEFCQSHDIDWTQTDHLETLASAKDVLSK